MEVKNSSNLEKDDPINTKSEDKLDFYDEACQIANKIEIIGNKTSVSFGIQGKWGEGKSSLLNMVKLVLNEKINKYIFIDFNPRQSKDIRTIQDDFFKVLSDELCEYNHFFYIKLIRYLSTIGLENHNLFLKTLFKVLNVNKKNARLAMENALRRLPYRVVVFLDDLDRLLGDEIIEVFKIIRNNSNFCNIIFVTCYDKDYINKVLSTYLKYEDGCFSDKYVTVEFNVPIRPNHTYINILYGLIYKQLKIENENNSLLKFFGKNVNLFSKRLHDLRSVKRFYNQFINDYLPFKDEVKLEDYILLSLIKFSNRKEFDLLHQKEYITNSSIFNYTDSGFYILKSEYKENYSNEKSVLPDSIDIIRHLFPESDSGLAIPENYLSIKKISSFEKYFINRVYGRLKQKELESLYFLDYDGIKIKLHEWNDSGLASYITEFVTYKDFNYIYDGNHLQNEECVKKQLFIAIFQYGIKPDLNLLSYILKMLNKENIKFLVTYEMSELAYSSYVKDLLKGENNEYLSYAINTQLLFLLLDNSFSGDISLVVSIDEIQKIALEMLDSYKKMDMFFFNIFDSCIKEKKNNVYTYLDRACTIMKERINKNPKFFIDTIKTLDVWNVHIRRIYEINNDKDEFIEFLETLDDEICNNKDNIINDWTSYKKNNY